MSLRPINLQAEANTNIVDLRAEFAKRKRAVDQSAMPVRTRLTTSGRGLVIIDTIRRPFGKQCDWDVPDLKPTEVVFELTSDQIRLVQDELSKLRMYVRCREPYRMTEEVAAALRFIRWQPGASRALILAFVNNEIASGRCKPMYCGMRLGQTWLKHTLNELRHHKLITFEKGKAHSIRPAPTEVET